jgi:uncharacterized protein with FMN-binding domain
MMHENWKPYVVTILLLASPLTFGWTQVEADGADQKEIVLRAGNPSVKINGTEIMLATAPKLIGNSIYVPLRFIGTQLGADVQWLQQEKSVNVKTSEMNIQLWMDQKKAMVNGKEILLETPPVNVQGTSMVPLSFVSENLDTTISFNPVTKEVSLLSGDMDENSTYADGEYTATGFYGGLPSSITVTLTLDDDIIIAVEVTPHATNETSLDLQRRFAEAVPAVVVGKRIDEVNVGRLAGSSGTPEGFNAAIEQISAKAEEKADNSN